MLVINVKPHHHRKWGQISPVDTLVVDSSKRPRLPRTGEFHHHCNYYAPVGSSTSVPAETPACEAQPHCGSRPHPQGLHTGFQAMRGTAVLRGIVQTETQGTDHQTAAEVVDTQRACGTAVRQIAGCGNTLSSLCSFVVVDVVVDVVGGG